MNKEEKIVAIYDIGKDLAADAVLMLRYNRKTLRIIRKKPFNKQKGQLMKVNFMLNTFMSAIRVASIMSQPIPKRPQSGSSYGLLNPDIAIREYIRSASK